MTIIHSEHTALIFIISINRQICTLFKFDFPLSLDRNAAQCDIAEGRAVSHRKEIKLRMITLHLPAKHIPDLVYIRHIELLKADNIRFLFPYECKQGLLVTSGKPPDIV